MVALGAVVIKQSYKKMWEFTPTFFVLKLFIVKDKTMKDVMNFKDLPIKDRISYYVAIGMISSGVLLAFLSFFLNAYNIATGVLIYIAQCFVIGGGLVGANVYFKSKWIEFDTNAKREIENQINKLSDRFKD